MDSVGYRVFLSFFRRHFHPVPAGHPSYLMDEKTNPKRLPAPPNPTEEVSGDQRIFQEVSKLCELLVNIGHIIYLQMEYLGVISYNPLILTFGPNIQRDIQVGIRSIGCSANRSGPSGLYFTLLVFRCLTVFRLKVACAACVFRMQFFRIPWSCFLLFFCWEKMTIPGNSAGDLFGMVKTWPFEG